VTFRLIITSKRIVDKGYNGLSVYGSKTVVADGSDTRGLALQIQTEMPKYEELV
jgi:hypothetical protein